MGLILQHPAKNTHPQSGDNVCTLKHKAATDLLCLQVLNVGQNQIVGKLKLSNLPSLGAVIADNNAITGLKGTSQNLHPPLLHLKSPCTPEPRPLLPLPQKPISIFPPLPAIMLERAATFRRP